MKPFGPPPATHLILSMLPVRIVVLAAAAALCVLGIQNGIPLALLLGSVLLVTSATPLAAAAWLVRREHRAQVETGELTEQPLTYPVRAMGYSLDPGLVADPPKGYRATGRRATIGAGREAFDRASTAVLRWEIKTRAGFRVIRVGGQGAFFSDGPVAKGECAIVTLGPVRETVRVVRVVDEPRRRGFAYGTLPEHPLRGEEAFLVEWRDDDTVELAVRSFSRPSTALGWLLYPLLLLAQQFFVRRYLRVLLE